MITRELLCGIDCFRELDEANLSRIAAISADIRLRAGDWLACEGETAAFFVLLDGELNITKRIANSRRTVTVRRPGEFFGETPILLGSPFLVAAQATAPVRALRLEALEFLRLYHEIPTFHETVMTAFKQRVTGIQEEVADCDQLPVVFGNQGDHACYNIREFLTRNRVMYEWFDPERGAHPRFPATSTGADLPLVVMGGGEIFVKPTREQLATAFGYSVVPARSEYDVVVIGAGPAGLAASVYGASEGLRTLAVERDASGGQAGTSSRIENYLGFPAGLSGDDLAGRAFEQAQRFGAEMLLAREITSIEPGSPRHTIHFDDGRRVQAAAIVVATGVSYRMLPAKNSEAYIGAGLYYGAARTEGPATLGHDIIIVGGGNSAGQAAMYFSNFARSVSILIRGESLTSSMSQYLIDQIAGKENISIHAGAQITEILGELHVAEVVIADDSGLRRQPVDAIFVFIGADAQTDWLPAEMIRDERGYICTGRDVLDLARQPEQWPLERDPFLLETNIPGIFAAGDVRHGSIKRVAAGVGEGSMSIAFAHQYLASLTDKAPALR